LSQGDGGLMRTHGWQLLHCGQPICFFGVGVRCGENAET
jgi:nicotinic acid phosphoribosyltransferase